MGECCVSAFKQSEREGLEPKNRQALSHLLYLLDDKDEPACESAVPLSPASLVAFHAKAVEFASILNQDSPALSFNFTHQRSLPASEASYRGFQCSRESGSFLAQSPPQVIPPAPLLGPGSTAGHPPAYGADCRHSHNKHHSRLIALKAGSKNEFLRSKDGDGRNPSYLYADIHDMVIECAHVIGCNNTDSAAQLLGRVRQFASANGSGTERVAYYFAKALDVRLSGIGRQMYSGCSEQHGPSSHSKLKAIFMYMSSCPLAKALYYFLKEVVLDAAKGARTLSIVEHVVTVFPYRSLFKALATRPGGPPQVRLLAANMSLFAAISDYNFVLETLEERGRQLLASASLYGVPFQFTTWPGSADALECAGFVSPHRQEDEKLVVLSGYPLHFVYDDFLDPPTKRADLLKTMRALNPDLYVQGFAVGSYNAPIFPRRVKEALFHFECLYDMLDTFCCRENVDRSVFESEILGKSVLNVVAFEDTTVARRVTMYKPAHAHIQGGQDLSS